MSGPDVSILVVSYNAARHARRLMASLATTTGVRHEVVVVDNRSRWPTRLFWARQVRRRTVASLTLLPENTLFAHGCNVAARTAHPDARYLLLLNTDVVVRDPRWLAELVAAHGGGATGYGAVHSAPPRADGYCLLVERSAWDELGGLDERFAWWWAVTRLQADLLRSGRPVRAVRDHEQYVTHVGGGSGRPPLGAAGMDTDRQEVVGWFGDHQVEFL